MAEQRYRTVIEIGVDAREVEGLDRTVHRAFDEKALIAFERSVQRSTRAMSQLVRETEKLERVLRRVQGLGGPTGGGGGFGGVGGMAGGGGGGGGGGDQAAALRNLAAAIRGLQRSNEQQGRRQMGRTAAGTMLGNIARGGAGGTATQALVTALPWVGPLLGAGLGAMQQFYGENQAVQEQRARAFGTVGYAAKPSATAMWRQARPGERPGPRRAGRAGMARFGYDQGQAVGQLQTIAGATGRRGAAGLAGARGHMVPTLMEAQEYMGLGSLGGMLGAAEVSGGQVADPTQMFLRSIGQGVATGIRISRLDRLFAQVASSVEDLRGRGFDVTPESMMMLSQGISGLGPSMRDEAGANFARGMVGAMTGGLGRSPGSASLVALRAVGYGQPGVGYQEAMRRIQSGRPEYAAAIVRAVNQAAGGDPAVASELHQQLGSTIYGRVPSQRQADDLASGNIEFITQNQAEARGGLIMAAQEAEGRRVQGASAGEAAYRNRRIGLGGNRAIRRGVANMRSMDMQVATATLPIIADGVSTIVEFIQGSIEAFRDGGITAMIAHAGGELIQGFMRHVSTAITSAMTEVIVLIATALNSIPGVNIDVDALRRRAESAQAGAERGTSDEALRAASGGAGATGEQAHNRYGARRARRTRQFGAAMQRHQEGGGQGMPPYPAGMSPEGRRGWQEAYQRWQEANPVLHIPLTQPGGAMGPDSDAVRALEQSAEAQAFSAAATARAAAAVSTLSGGGDAAVVPGQ